MIFLIWWIESSLRRQDSQNNVSSTYFYDDKYEGRIPQNIGQQTVGQIPKTNVSVAQECST